MNFDWLTSTIGILASVMTILAGVFVIWPAVKAIIKMLFGGPSPPPPPNPHEYFIKTKNVGENRKASATALVFDNGNRVVVKEGSQVAAELAPATPEATLRLRKRLMTEGVIAQKDGKMVFSKDYPFPNPSSAAMIVLGAAASGFDAWKDGAGRRLGDNRARQN